MPASPHADCDMVIADGSVRAGKTIAMITGFLLWTTQSFEHETFILAGKSIGALNRNVIHPMLQILRASNTPFVHRRGDNIIEVGSNTYYCFGANNEASQDTLQGLTAAGALADEAALFPWSFIEQMIARCSADDAKIWLNCNPESPHHPVKTELIDKAAEKNILHLHFTMDDNLTLSERVKDRFRRMYSGVWFKRFILGLWVAAEGAIYDMLDDSEHVVDILPKMLRYWVSCDYGPGSVTTFWLLGEGKDAFDKSNKTLYFVDFWRRDKKDNPQPLSDSQITEAISSWLDSLEITPDAVVLPVDAVSLASHMQAVRDKHPRLRRLAWADMTPGSVNRGIQDVSTLLTMGLLKFSRTVHRKGGLDEWHGYVWDDKAQLRGEDKPLKQDDHNPDAGRYCVEHVKTVWYKWLRSAA
jgi:PBSX family phage terminase large subunit